MKIEILPAAEREYVAARDWYESIQAGLGDRFALLVRESMRAIRRNPLRYRVDKRGYHRAFVSVFPYKIWYRIDDQLIIVVAFAHNHRRPDYWLDRQG